MMKKLGTLALVALMLCASMVSTVLATDVSYIPYTNPTDGYQISYPSDWVLADKDTLDSTVESLTSGSIPGLDASALEPYKAQIAAMDMVIALGQGGMVNFNVVYQTMPMEFPSDLIISQMAPATVTQLQSVFSDAVVEDAGSVVMVGDREYVHLALKYSLNGMNMDMEQYYCSAGTTLYTITFTRTGMGAAAEMDFPAAVDGIMQTFVPGQK